MSTTFRIPDIYSQTEALEAPNADYAAIEASLGPGCALNKAQVSAGIANLSTLSPIVVAFVLSSTPGRIYLRHSTVVQLCFPFIRVDRY